MLSMPSGRTFRKKLSGQPINTSMTGPDGGTSMYHKQNGPNLVGNAKQTSFYIDGVETTALLDTGSCISSLSQPFYQKNCVV